MTDTEIRIAIARACGLHPYVRMSSGKVMYSKTTQLGQPDTDGSITDVFEVPDYLNDLNAMHDAEQAVLADALQERYWDYLRDTICGPVEIEYPDAKFNDMNTKLILLFSTARQRAEAFLRTIGKWTEHPTPPLAVLNPRRVREGAKSEEFMPLT